MTQLIKTYNSLAATYKITPYDVFDLIRALLFYKKTIGKSTIADNNDLFGRPVSLNSNYNNINGEHRKIMLTSMVANESSLVLPSNAEDRKLLFSQRKLDMCFNLVELVQINSTLYRFIINPHERVIPNPEELYALGRANGTWISGTDA
jgi:hypothetical protein